MMLPKAVKLTMVLAATAAFGSWMAYNEPSPQPTLSGEEDCKRTAEMMPTAARTHACVKMLPRPRPGAELSEWVLDDRNATANEPR